MATTFGGQRIATLATAHNLTTVRARTIARAIPRATYAGMIQWLNAAENQNADEAAWREAWPGLAPLTNDEIHFVMELVADLGGGIYVP